MDTSVADLRPRHDGWTPDRQRAFLAALADTGAVAEAARRIGLSPASAYALRRHPGAAAFRTAWDGALADAWRRVEETALERVINGETEVWDRDGVQVIRHRPCAPQLVIHMLERAERTNAATRAQAERESGMEQARKYAAIRADLRALPAPGATGDTGDDDENDWVEPPPPEDPETINLRRFAEVAAALRDHSEPGSDG